MWIASYSSLPVCDPITTINVFSTSQLVTLPCYPQPPGVWHCPLPPLAPHIASLRPQQHGGWCKLMPPSKWQTAEGIPNISKQNDESRPKFSHSLVKKFTSRQFFFVWGHHKEILRKWQRMRTVWYLDIYIYLDSWICQPFTEPYQIPSGYLT